MTPHSAMVASVCECSGVATVGGASWPGAGTCQVSLVSARPGTSPASHRAIVRRTAQTSRPLLSAPFCSGGSSRLPGGETLHRIQTLTRRIPHRTHTPTNCSSSICTTRPLFIQHSIFQLCQELINFPALCSALFLETCCSQKASYRKLALKFLNYPSYWRHQLLSSILYL